MTVGTMRSLQLTKPESGTRSTTAWNRSRSIAWDVRCLARIGAIILLAAGGHQPNVLAEDFAGVVRASLELFEPSTPVSDAFRLQTAEVARTIPPQVWGRLRAAGWRVRLAEFTIDGHPSLQYDRPRGWPADMSWNNIDAALIPTERLLVLAEKRRNRRGQIVPTVRVAGVFRHELGHAFDAVTGATGHYRSRATDFQFAYQTDCGHMSVERRAELGYYLQADDAGRQETYAEAFGIVLGGGSDLPHREAFEASFPRVLELVRADLGQPSP